MRVLAIDTSSRVLGVAVLDEDGREAELNYNFELRHTSHLIPTIKNVLKFAGLELKDIDAYCVSVGPGSFTGLRIGVSSIKALAFADKKKVIAVPSLDVLAYNISNTGDTICVIVDAKKEKLYACFYEYKTAVLKKISPALLIGYRDLLDRISKIKNDILLVGDGIEKLIAHSSELKASKIKIADKEFWWPRAINVARIGLKMLKKGDVVKKVDSLVPVYLHPRDVQCKK